MIGNAERIFSFRRQFSSSTPERILFKEEVKLLWTSIDGLWAYSYGDESCKPSLKLSLDFGQAVFGWEYMDLVKNEKHLDPKSIDLRKSSGQWNHYAKNIKAISFFGAEFGNVLGPLEPRVICRNFASLPKDQCYLAVRVNTLEDLFSRQGSLQDQKRLTSSGFALQGPKQLFETCKPGIHAFIEDCKSRHMVRLVSQSALRKEHTLIPFEDH
jgi:hypothetical protein